MGMNVREKCDGIVKTMEELKISKKKYQNIDLPRIKYKFKLTKKTLKFLIWDEGFCQNSQTRYFHKKLYGSQGILKFQFDSSFFHEGEMQCNKKNKMIIKL